MHTLLKHLFSLDMSNHSSFTQYLSSSSVLKSGNPPTGPKVSAESHTTVECLP